MFFSGTHSKIGVRMDENQLQILDDLPSSAVEMQVKDKVIDISCDYYFMIILKNVMLIMTFFVN